MTYFSVRILSRCTTAVMAAALGLAIAVAPTQTQADPISVTNTALGQYNGVDPTNFTFSGFDLSGGNAIVAFVTLGDSNATSSVTFGGQPMTEYTINQGAQRASLYYLINPLSTIGDVVVTVAETGTAQLVGAADVIALNNVGSVASRNSLASTGDSLVLNYETTSPDGFVVGAFVDNAFQNSTNTPVDPTVTGDNIDTFLQVLNDTDEGVNSAGHLHAYGDIPLAGMYSNTYTAGHTNNNRIAAVTVALSSSIEILNQWNVDGGGSFNVAGNWSTNVVPTDVARFGDALSAVNAPATITVDSPISLNSIRFDNNSQYILAGPSTLTLTGEHGVVTQTGTHQITANVAGTSGLLKTGAGTLVLPNAKSYTGTTDVQAGTLQLNNLDAIDNQASGALNIAAAGTVILAPGATGTLSAQLTGSGLLSMPAELAPADTVTINRANATFGGLVRVNDGTLVVSNSDALGGGGFTINRTAITFQTTAKVALSGGVTVATEHLDFEGRATTDIGLTSSGNNTWNGVIVGEGTDAAPRFNIESTSGTLTLNALYGTEDADARTFVFSGAGNTTITGRLSDATINVDTGVVTPSVLNMNNIGVVKQGTGALTIAYATTNPDDYWLGQTAIEQGSIVVNASSGTDGELRSGNILIRSAGTLNISAFTNYSQQVGQTFRGTGTIVAGAANLQLVDVGSLAPGDAAGAIGTLTVQSGTATLIDPGLGGGGVWSFDVGNSTNTTGDLLNIAAGSLTVSSTPGITVRVTPAHGHLDAGNRTIVTHTGGTNSALNSVPAQITNVAGIALNTRQTVALNGDTAGQVNVVVSGEEAARTWNGNVSGAWEVAGAANWQQGDQQYFDLDRVTFNDSATGTTDVTVDGPRYAGSVTFSNATKSYSLTGSGGIVGTGGVSVTGTGDVMLANTGNNYSGDTNIASGGSLRMGSATVGKINNSGTLSLGFTQDIATLVQNGTQTIGAASKKVIAVEAENYQAIATNNAAVTEWQTIPDANGSPTGGSGQAMQANPGGANNLSTTLAQQNYTTYNLKFTEPGTYFFYARMRGEDADGNLVTGEDDSIWLSQTDLGNGITNPQVLSTRMDLGAASSAVDFEGTSSLDTNAFNYDWYLGRGQDGGFDRILVTQAEVDTGAVFQFKIATRESGTVLDKFAFVQDPDFTTAPAFGGITDADLDGVSVISSTQVEEITVIGNVLNVNGDLNMTSDTSVLNMFLATANAHDQLVVSGNLAANGILNVTAPNGLGVQSGDVFDILSFGSTSGVFDDINLPTLPFGLGWETSNLLVNGQISIVTTAIPGDFNNDGTVDAADYVAWRKDPNSFGGTPAGYNSWRANFGNSEGGGSGSSADASVPEPSTWILAVLALLVVGRRLR